MLVRSAGMKKAEPVVAASARRHDRYRDARVLMARGLDPTFPSSCRCGGDGLRGPGEGRAAGYCDCADGSARRRTG